MQRAARAGQERGQRGGTENVANMVAYGKAAELALAAEKEQLEIERQQLQQKRQLIEDQRAEVQKGQEELEAEKAAMMGPRVDRSAIEDQRQPLPCVPQAGFRAPQRHF